MHFQHKGSARGFYFAKMEEPEPGSREQVVIGPFRRIDVDLMPRAAPTAGDDEELSVDLKTFI
jgi:hypothetical protein